MSAVPGFKREVLLSFFVASKCVRGSKSNYNGRQLGKGVTENVREQVVGDFANVLKS